MIFNIYKIIKIMSDYAIDFFISLESLLKQQGSLVNKKQRGEEKEGKENSRRPVLLGS